MHSDKARMLKRRILSPALGRPRLQPIFQGMLRLALAGMGYGEGNNPATSGEKHVLSYIRQHLAAQERVTVFDVGANVGDYAEYVLEGWNAQVDLWCFEPSFSTYSVLIERLKGRPGVVVEQLGLSDATGTVTLHSRGEGSKVASVYERKTAEWRLDRHEEVQVSTLDAYCAAKGIERIDLLKLDVEGHELSVLRGAKAMIEAGAVRFIQFEIGAPCVDARVFFRDFWETLSPEYDLLRVAAHGLLPVADYDETMEVFKRATNYLAERRQAP